MPSAERVRAVVERCLHELSAQLPVGQALSADPETVLRGEGGRLDSLALVSLLANLEERLASELGLRASLIDLALDAGVDSPLRTVGSLVEHLSGGP